MIDARLGLEDAVDALVEAAERAIARDGVAHVVVPAGRSPARLFAALVARGLPGPGWHLHLADERAVDDDHPARNAPAVARALGLDRPDAPPLSGPPALDDAEAAARDYGEHLAEVGDFAAVVLGIGADGHVASVFPGDPAPLAADAPDALAVDAPDPRTPRRITLSARRLARTPLLLLVVDGEGKDAAVAAVEGEGDVPANAVRGPRRVLVDLRDEDARARAPVDRASARPAATAQPDAPAGSDAAAQPDASPGGTSPRV